MQRLINKRNTVRDALTSNSPNMRRHTSVNIYELLSTKDHNPHYLNRYCKFIAYCQRHNSINKVTKKTKINVNGVYMEGHHICPTGEFPEYKSFRKHSFNRIYLTPRQHFIAHYLLWKTFGRSQTVAFHKMACMPWHSNREEYIKISSKAYETLKLQYAHRQTENLQTPEIRKKRSETLKEYYRNNVHHRKGKEPPNKGKPSPLKGRQSKFKGISSGPKEVFTCEVCGKQIGGRSNYLRWHSTNCRTKT